MADEWSCAVGAGIVAFLADAVFVGIEAETAFFLAGDSLKNKTADAISASIGFGAGGAGRKAFLASFSIGEGLVRAFLEA